MVSAYAHDNGLALTQRRVDDKSNEITVLPEIIRTLELTDANTILD